MAKCKFKVGDIVRGTANGTYAVTNKYMTKGEVVEVTSCYIKVKVLEHKFGKRIGATFMVNPKHFEKIEEVIVIYRKDYKTVVALDKSTGKKAYARCHLIDTFDFRMGAKLALNRLTGEEERQDKLKVVKCKCYEVGDKVLIRDWDDMVKEFGTTCGGNIKCKYTFMEDMKKFCNTVVEISRVIDTGYRIKEDDFDWSFSNDMITGKVVSEPEDSKPECMPHLENCPARKEETCTEDTYYNGTIQLLDEYYYRGEKVNVIDIVDGIFKINDDIFPTEGRLRNLNEVIDYFYKAFTWKSIKVQEIKKVYTRIAKIGEYIRPLKDIESESVDLNTVYKILGRTFKYVDMVDVYTRKVIRVPRVFLEYAVLENYKEIEELKPHMEYKNGIFFGNLGEETPFKDAIGRTLRVGDTVGLYNSSNIFYGETPIVKDGKPFVYGISSLCNNDGTIECGWKIILKRKFEDILDGEIVDVIKYIKNGR